MTKKSIHLIFGCHSHQPVGNFDFVFEEAYFKSYVPFLDVLERFPALKTTLHYTGPLYDWVLKHHPEFLKRLARLVQSGQVEIMGGAYYEPLLCAIPERDATAQMARMRRFCEDHLGCTPRGAWLAERVWEPRMAGLLGRAGIEYAALDDSHFFTSGVPSDGVYGYYVTEDEGIPLKVFPILERLRYLIPFHQVSETIEYLRSLATQEGSRCAVIQDDGEKFGIWPGTYHSVYEEGWLEEFFQALTDNQDWIRSVTYSEYVAEAPSLGRAYLACASYQEMMTWALPTPLHRSLVQAREDLKATPDLAARCAPFMRGGFWRHFLVKYPEANNIQKRMLLASNRLERLRARHQEETQWREAERLIHESQCNCAYWHGAFGGLYLNHLRTALYNRIIEASVLLDLLEGRDSTYLACEILDFDLDGNDEVLLENTALALFLDPSDGGTLFEMDYKPKPFNLLNTLARRDEAYHDALRDGRATVASDGQGEGSIHDMVQVKEAGLEKLLIYDPYRRATLRDHFFLAPPSPELLSQSAVLEAGSFATGPYGATKTEEGVTLTRVESWGDNLHLSVEKTLRLTPGESCVEIRYDIDVKGGEALGLVFGIEIGVNFLTGSADDRYYVSEDAHVHHNRLGTIGTQESTNHIALRDDWQELEFGVHLAESATLHRFPIETVSQSESGQERVYQGSMVVACWPIPSSTDAHVTRTLRLEVRNTGKG